MKVNPKQMEAFKTNAAAVLSVAAFKFKDSGKYHPSVKDTWSKEEAPKRLVALLEEAVRDLQREIKKDIGVDADGEQVIRCCVIAMEEKKDEGEALHGG